MNLQELNTPHFCKWYLQKLHAVLDREKVCDYDHMPCNSFDDLVRIVIESQDLHAWDRRAKRWATNNPVIFCHYLEAGTEDCFDTEQLTLYLIENEAIGLVPFFPRYINEYIPPVEYTADLVAYFGSVSQFYPATIKGKVLERIRKGDSRRVIANFIFESLEGYERAVITKYVKDTFEPPYYAFDVDRGGYRDGFTEDFNSSKFLILPNKDLIRKKELITPVKSVESSKPTKPENIGMNLIGSYMYVMAEPLHTLPTVTCEDIAKAGKALSFAGVAKKLVKAGARTDSQKYRDRILETDDIGKVLWFDYAGQKVITSNLDAYIFLLPVPIKCLPNGNTSVLYMDDVTNFVETTTKGTTTMNTIKQSALKSKDQVIKTAIGQAGVAGIKSLILTALPMKIGFIGRLLGRHRQVANNSLVVAGLAIVANQAGQKYISNEAVKNALQATQDQALSEVLNEYVGIENQVAKVVDSALQLDKEPVTLDQD